MHQSGTELGGDPLESGHNKCIQLFKKLGYGGKDRKTPEKHGDKGLFKRHSGDVAQQSSSLAFMRPRVQFPAP